MATVNSGIREDANFLNLKEIAQKQVKSEVNNMLVTGENIIQCFQTVRDQVQGITGKKTSYFSYPYSKVLYFGIETAGVLDIDSELIMTFANGTVLQFDFRSKVDIKGICSNIQQYIL